MLNLFFHNGKLFVFYTWLIKLREMEQKVEQATC